MQKTIIAATLIMTSILMTAPALAAPAPFYNTTKSLKFGMSGPAVVALQLFLAGRGILAADKATGYFGFLTLRAVKTFQSENGIESTGLVGPKTKDKIRALELQVALPAIISIATDTAPTVIVATTTAVVASEISYNLEARPVYDFKKIAKEIQNLINYDRGMYGLNPIYWDEDLAGVAQEHSDDQARDNVITTDVDMPCHYPMIRHEGMTIAGYSLKDRYSSGNIKFIYGGENIAMVPIDKELLYLQRADAPAIVCPEVEKYPVEAGPEEEKLALFKKILEESKVAIQSTPKVQWVNRQWRTDKEIEEMVVDGWMNSPGHRDNILRKEYTVAGIGIATVNNDIIVTHNFVGR